ncbi:MAG TPA: hypothetical protein VNP92_26365 [Actinophytocola sp.]|nr:hypothetical protein [Actinophytocola sp.]
MAELVLPADVDEAVRLQERLAPRVERVPPPGFAPRTAAGLDVVYGPTPQWSPPRW